MKKLNFKLLVVLCMITGIVTGAKAQINSSEVCFYSQAGTSNVCYAIKFDYVKGNLLIQKVSHNEVKKHLAESESYYEDNVWKQGHFEFRYFDYDPNISTSSKEVYKWEGKVFTDKIIGYGNSVWDMGQPIHESFDGYMYIAVSKDKSSIIRWSEKKYDGEIKAKEDYTRVPKEDLLPKAANYDFLND